MRMREEAIAKLSIGSLHAFLDWLVDTQFADVGLKRRLARETDLHRKARILIRARPPDVDDGLYAIAQLHGILAAGSYELVVGVRAAVLTAAEAGASFQDFKELTFDDDAPEQRVKERIRRQEIHLRNLAAREGIQLSSPTD
jgi:hypothetical protein